MDMTDEGIASSKGKDNEPSGSEHVISVRLEINENKDY